MWRPDKWENPYPDLTEEALTEKYLIQALSEPKSDYEVFEAGADAMLEALEKEGYYITRYGFISASSLLFKLKCGTTAGRAGWIVFIPGEEDEKPSV